jgi:uncharacterized membrane-anchored protein
VNNTNKLSEPGRIIATKVPEITIFFWIIKILTTAMGESTSDYLITIVDPAFAVVLVAIGLIIAFVLQFSAGRYVAWIYWFTVVMVAIFGTMAADVLHAGLGIPYIATTLFFIAALIVIFMAWYKIEGTLSIHSITTRRREGFYWATVLATFALGTATGDMTAATLGLGFLNSGILFAILIALVVVAHYVVKALLGTGHSHQSRNAVFAFWLAYILTRPLGASFADWMGKPPSIGGLGWGDGSVSLGLFIIILCLVSYMAISRKDIKS